MKNLIRAFWITLAVALFVMILSPFTANAASTCPNDYAKLQDAMLRVYGRVLIVTPKGVAHLSASMKDREWGEIDAFIVGTHEATRTMDVLLFKCSKLVKSFIQMTVDDFNAAQTVWLIERHELREWKLSPLEQGPAAKPVPAPSKDRMKLNPDHKEFEI